MGAMLNGRFIVLDVAQSKISASDVVRRPDLGRVRGSSGRPRRTRGRRCWSPRRRARFTRSASSPRTSLRHRRHAVPVRADHRRLIPWGIGAPFSAVDYRGRIMWLAQNKDGDRKVVVALAGYSTANVISNEALEHGARHLRPTINDAEGFVYDDTARAPTC
jgi:hypothetical protein